MSVVEELLSMINARRGSKSRSRRAGLAPKALLLAKLLRLGLPRSCFTRGMTMSRQRSFRQVWHKLTQEQKGQVVRYWPGLACMGPGSRRA